MTSISWNAEGGTNGSTITAGNSGGASGTAWDVVTIGTNAAVTYDSSQSLSGSYSAKFTTGATSTTCYVRRTTSITALWASGLTTCYDRIGVRFDALPATSRIIAEYLDAGLANRVNVQLLSSGAVRLRNAANGTVVTSSTLLTINKFWRLELRHDGANPGAYRLDIFDGNATVATESIVGGTANFGGPISAASYGWLTAAANSPTLWLDCLQINDTGLPGPESTTYTATASGSATALATAFGSALGEGAAAASAEAAASSSALVFAEGVGAAAATAEAAASSFVEVLGTPSGAAEGSAGAGGFAQAEGSSAGGAVGESTAAGHAVAAGSVAGAAQAAASAFAVVLPAAGPIPALRIEAIPILSAHSVMSAPSAALRAASIEPELAMSATDP